MSWLGMTEGGFPSDWEVQWFCQQLIAQKTCENPKMAFAWGCRDGLQAFEPRKLASTSLPHARAMTHRISVMEDGSTRTKGHHALLKKHTCALLPTSGASQAPLWRRQPAALVSTGALGAGASLPNLFQPPERVGLRERRLHGHHRVMGRAINTDLLQHTPPLFFPLLELHMLLRRC